ncbi:unnamed protein product, partial [Closterium sp. NIES-54]
MIQALREELAAAASAAAATAVKHTLFHPSIPCHPTQLQASSEALSKNRDSTEARMIQALREELAAAASAAAATAVKHTL